MKVVVIPSYEFFSMYGGTRNLLTRLSDLGIDVRVFVRIDPKNRPMYDGLSFGIDYYAWWSPSWPKWKRICSILFFRVIVCLKVLFADRVILIDSLYLPEVAWVKRIRPNLKVIQFCQELQIPSDYPHKREAKIYQRYAKVPDMVLDVDSFRANKRLEYFGLKKLPLVLLNTISATCDTHKHGSLTLAALARIDKLPVDVPIIIYAGGIGVEKPFSRLVDAVKAQSVRCFFLAFCSAPQALVKEAQQYAQEHLCGEMHRVCEGVKHADLLAVLNEADVGVVDYPYSWEKSWNQKYCAPTKLYEYMASGLAVVGSDNETLRSVIESNGAGCCAASDSTEDLGAALGKVIADPRALMQMKKNSRHAFLENYAYEKSCYPVIENVVEFLK